MSEQIQKQHLLELTSTRFIAAFAVLLGHFSDLLNFPSFLAKLISGGVGVSFFFVLSGFILCYRYYDIFKSGVASQRFFEYFVARLARVYPMYLVALLGIATLQILIVKMGFGVLDFPPDPYFSFFINLLALQTFSLSTLTQQFWNAPGWSISTEFGFYLILPVLLAYVAKANLSLKGLLKFFMLTIVLACLAQSIAIAAVIFLGWDRVILLDFFAARNIFWRFPEFITGVIIARALFTNSFPALQVASNRNMILVGGIFSALLLNVLPWPESPTAVMIMRQFRVEIGYTMPFAAIIVALAAGRTFLSPVLQHRYFVFLGEISYSLYILHWIPWVALSIAKASGRSITPGITAVAIVATMAVSALCFLWIEKPARKLIRSSVG
jgi:peptidoglycan/LPS O-acetylase OafA/YrhL